MYYVYVARVDGKIVYVGKGSGDRYKHLTSGYSHVKEANEAKKKGHSIIVTIEEKYDDEWECLEAERLLIKVIRPLWNKNLKPKTFEEEVAKVKKFMDKLDPAVRAAVLALYR